MVGVAVRWVVGVVGVAARWVVMCGGCGSGMGGDVWQCVGVGGGGSG